MDRELQKAKARSSVSTVKAKNHGRTKTGRRKVDFLGNKAIAENWDRKQTVTQNYKRLGLSSQLNAATGGVEKFKPGKENNSMGVIAINREKREAKIRTMEVQVKRDEEGRILKVIRPEGVERERVPNPLGDLLNDVEDEEEEDDNDEETRDTPGKSNVVAALEQEAVDKAERIAKKRPRLVAKYGQVVVSLLRSHPFALIEAASSSCNSENDYLDSDLPKDNQAIERTARVLPSFLKSSPTIGQCLV